MLKMMYKDPMSEYGRVDYSMADLISKNSRLFHKCEFAALKMMQHTHTQNCCQHFQNMSCSLQVLAANFVMNKQTVIDLVEDTPRSNGLTQLTYV